MNDKRICAEPIHPWEYIAEELEARRWSLEDLAMKMRAPEAKDLAVNLLTLEMIEACSDPTFKHYANCRIGKETNARIAEALGWNPQTLDNLEESWRKSVEKYGPPKP